MKENYMLDRIVSIEKLPPAETLDIEVDGNHLFYADSILTHNSNSDVSMTDTADSIGLVMSLDVAFVLIATEELTQMQQIIIKMLKNRYGELDKFIYGLDKSKMQFFQCEESANTLSRMATSVKPTKQIDAPVRLASVANKFQDFKF
jgi:hypothetical protein